MWQPRLEPWWSFRVELVLPVYLRRIFMFSTSHSNGHDGTEWWSKDLVQVHDMVM